MHNNLIQWDNKSNICSKHIICDLTNTMSESKIENIKLDTFENAKWQGE